MMLSQFLDRCKEITGWYLTTAGLIRHKDGACPVCEVGTLLGKNLAGSRAAFLCVAENLGLSWLDTSAIVHAADNKTNYYPSENIRQRLLEACGLSGDKV